MKFGYQARESSSASRGVSVYTRITLDHDRPSIHDRLCNARLPGAPFVGLDWTGLSVCAAFLTVWVVTNRVGRSVSWTILGKLCALCAGVYFLVDLLACRRITLDSARLIYSRPLRRTIFIPVADITDAYPTDWQRSFSVNSGPA